MHGPAAGDRRHRGPPEIPRPGLSPLSHFQDTCSCVLLDLEGTIVPLEFVQQVLFPYSSEHLEGYLRSPEAEESLTAWAAALRAESATASWPGDAPSLADDGPSALHHLLQWLIANDVKSPVLKSVQGRIWRKGYQDGSIQGRLFPGVAGQLRLLNAAGVPLAIYSSGSVEAQKLLMAHSEDGDLAPLFSGWFDTAMGPKTDPGSYLRIADALHLEPGRILFATDHPGEARAAHQAGLAVALSLRGVAKPVDAESLRPLVQFAEQDVLRPICALAKVDQ